MEIQRAEQTAEMWAAPKGFVWAVQKAARLAGARVAQLAVKWAVERVALWEPLLVVPTAGH